MRVYEASLSFNLVQLGNDNKVDTPAKVVEYLASAFATNPTQEAFWVIMLDRKNRAIGRVMITLGTLTSSLVHPREVFRPAILASAAAIIAAHNLCDASHISASIFTVDRQKKHIIFLTLK
jgi:DNA repair protein RadC